MNIVKTSFSYHRIVILLVTVLMMGGVYALKFINKNEFPDCTVRQGIVVAVCPGATAEQVEQEVTKPLEDYIFTYKDVRKEKTTSTSMSGMSVVQVQLNDEIEDKEEFWAKFKHGVNEFKAQLPRGVVAVVVLDDFGDSSALLVTMESDDKTYRQLSDYMDQLKDCLRRVEAVGRMTVTGMQKDQVSIILDNDRLARYGLSDRTLAMTLFSKGFTTTAGRIRDEASEQPIYVNRSEASVRDIEEMIVLSTPAGNVVRLKDVAEVRREYPSPDSCITNNGHKCLLLSVEMKKGKDIVAMGEAVKEQIAEFQETLPRDITLYNITDQSKVVDDAVMKFLSELAIAVVAVIIVVMLLLPMRVALVSAGTIPITIFISLGLFMACGLELNCITLCVLILSLGMVVDNCIVIIDSYLEKLGLLPQDLPREEYDRLRREASIDSARHFFRSIFSATLAISVTFFPILFTVTGMPLDFLESFPWAISIVLFTSLLVAELLVPYLQYTFIKNPLKPREKEHGENIQMQTGRLTWKKHTTPSMLDLLQRSYNKVIGWCFRHTKTTLTLGIGSVLLGILLMGSIPQKLMPIAERNQFAVEIYLPSGTSLEKTSMIADSLERMMRRDPRVLSVASFHGSGSPRFQFSYAPQMGGTNFAQFIVNTPSNDDTVDMLDEFQDLYADYFPEAYVRFKQMSYSEAVSPLEVRLTGSNLDHLRLAADSIQTVLRQWPELKMVRSNLNEPRPTNHIALREDYSTRLGLTNIGIESTLALRYGSGMQVASVYEDDDEVPVVIKSTRADASSATDLSNEQIPVVGGIDNVPLRQVADIVTEWELGSIPHRNGVRCVTVSAEFDRTERPNGMVEKEKVERMIASRGSEFLPADVNVTYGGDFEESDDNMPKVMRALAISIMINFFILLFHYRNARTATLLLFCFALCLPGTAIGVKLMDCDFGCTCVMGVISLLGILVRNSIIMLDYTNELLEEGQTMYDACLHAAQRRMRPIFLTSAAASMGVLPMVTGGSQLWVPMGSVIFFGTLITMLFILTVIPVAYYTINKHTIYKKSVNE